MYKEIKLKNTETGFQPIYFNSTSKLHKTAGCIRSAEVTFKDVKEHYLFLNKEHYLWFSDEDVLEYLKFLNNAGFKIDLENTDISYKFVFETEFYKTFNFMLSGYTALRYMFSSWFSEQRMLPVKAIETFNKLEGKVDEFEALQIAHYLINVGSYGWDSLHSLFKRPSTLVNKDTFIEKMRNTTDLCTVNNGFFNKGINKDVLQLYRLSEKDFDSFLKIIKPDAKEVLSESSEQSVVC